LESAYRTFETEQAARQADVETTHATTEQQDHAAAELTKLQNELEVIRTSLDTDREALETERRRLTADRERLAEEGRLHNEQLVALHDRLEQLQAERDAERAHHVQMLQQLEQQQAELTAPTQHDEDLHAVDSAEH